MSKAEKEKYISWSDMSEEEKEESFKSVLFKIRSELFKIKKDE